MDRHVTFSTQGVCAREISFDIVDNHIFNVKFTGGCAGNSLDPDLTQTGYFSEVPGDGIQSRRVVVALYADM